MSGKQPPHTAEANMAGTTDAVTDRIYFLLLQAGATADEVAATLHRLDVRGHRGSAAFNNPIVRYLYRTLDIGVRLAIIDGSVVVGLVLDGRTETVSLPAAVREFLDRFHKGFYLDLC
jgi:hypothetical protein